MILKWTWFPLMLSMHENWFLVGWACMKLVTHWLSICENWLHASWAYAKIIFVYHVHFWSSSSLPPVTLSTVPFSYPCLTSFVPCLTSSLLLCPLSKSWALSRESGKEKTKVRPDCSSAPTQLALCLRLAYFRFKRRELTTRRNPRWLDSTMQN